MLKWTASVQRLNQDVAVTPLLNSSMVATMASPACSTKLKRHKRRATIANKENIPVSTSTPMGVNRLRNSPMVMVPLADILNVTPEPVVNRTPERRRNSLNAFVATRRRHSSVGFIVPPVPQYAATLPKYEEEYSPSNILPTGQQLALRGLLPDPFMDNPRYFTTPEVALPPEHSIKGISSLPKKRKLEQEFVALAQEEEEKQQESKTKKESNKMGDQTLNNLIESILDSARKEIKKKKSRKSFNLRRRTLLKNQAEQQQDIILSPSYAAGDDPCSDVSFLNCEGPLSCNSEGLYKSKKTLPATPQPATPPPGFLLSQEILLQKATPPLQLNDSFSLDTPVRTRLKRRSKSNARPEANNKKYKVNSRNYLEIGVALPSVYV